YECQNFGAESGRQNVGAPLRKSYEANTPEKSDSCFLLDFMDQGYHSRRFSLEIYGNKRQELFGCLQRWLADQTGRAQVGLAATASGISSADVSGVSCKGSGHG